MAYQWSFEPLWSNWNLLLEGIATTVLLAVSTMALSAPLGAALAIAIEFGWKPIRLLAIAYIEFFRSLPLLVLIFWVFLVMPLLLGWTLTPFTSGLLALTLNVSAFVCEGFRAGIVSAGPGQRQAGLAIGMTTLQLIRRVVWPQAWRQTVPIVGSIWVGLFKDSALVSLIQVHDLMFEGRVIANRSFRYLEVYSVVALLYYLISYPLSRAVDRFYERFRTVE
jgi:polar amino acid transport system permease protein